MAKHSHPPPPGTDETPAGAPQAVEPESRYHIEHYHKTRHWAVYEGTALLAVTVYKRGAQAVQERLQTLDAQLAAQQVCIATLTQAGAPAVPPAAAALSSPVPAPPASGHPRAGRPRRAPRLIKCPAHRYVPGVRGRQGRGWLPGMGGRNAEEGAFFVSLGSGGAR